MGAKGWSAYETIYYRFPNLNFGGHDRATAQQLVDEGKGRWAWCQGGVFAFVPVDYELKRWEHFLIETSTGFKILEVHLGLEK